MWKSSLRLHSCLTYMNTDGRRLLCYCLCLLLWYLWWFPKCSICWLDKKVSLQIETQVILEKALNEWGSRSQLRKLPQFGGNQPWCVQVWVFCFRNSQKIIVPPVWVGNIHHDLTLVGWIVFLKKKTTSGGKYLSPPSNRSWVSSFVVYVGIGSVGGSGSIRDDCIYLRHLKSQNTWLTDPKKVAYSKGPIWTNTLGRLANVPFQFMYMNGWFLFSGGGNSKIFFIFAPMPGEIIQFDYHMFQVDWNHQLDGRGR